MPPPWLTYLGEKGGELWAKHMGSKKWYYWEHNEEHIGNLGTLWEDIENRKKTKRLFFQFEIYTDYIYFFNYI
jgi:hypothetical protein